MENVKNNKEKYYSYKTQIEKYNRAVEEGFYYEAMLISYAIMEDRLLTFLDIIGFVRIPKTSDEKLSVSEELKPYLRSLVGEKNIDIKNISAKRRLIESIVKMSYEEAEQYEKAYAEKQKTEKMNGYLQDLYMDIDESGIDRKEALEMLDKLSKWCDHRNDIIHGLLDIQTGENFDIEVKSLAEESIKLWRYLDNKLVSKLSNCRLREKYNIH